MVLRGILAKKLKKIQKKGRKRKKRKKIQKKGKNKKTEGCLECFEDLECILDFSEGSANLNALYEGFNLFQDFLGYEDTVLECGFFRVSIFHGIEDPLRDGDTGDFAVEEEGIFIADEGPYSGDNGCMEVWDIEFNLLVEVDKRIGVEDRLCDNEVSTGLDFLMEARDFVLEVRGRRFEANADEEGSGFTDGFLDDIESLVKGGDEMSQGDGIEIEDWGGIGVFAQFGWVTGDGEDIADTEGMSPEDIGLDSEDIFISASIMCNGFKAGLLFDDLSEDQRTHAGRGARSVGYIDGMDVIFFKYIGF